MFKKISPVISNWPVWALIVSLFSLLGIGLVLYSTVWGAALSDDSYYYISSARNLLAGRGFDLVANFPPVLPLALSLIGLFKVDPLTSIRWLNAILFGANIFLIARITLSLTKSFAFSILGAFLALISSTMIMIHSWAMSEALFIMFILSGLLVYTVGFEKGSWRVPFILGLLWGLAAATRYIGVFLLLAGGLLWLFESGKGIRIRLRNTLIFSIAGVIPLLLWVIRNEIVLGQATNRILSWHPMTGGMWINALNTMLLWIIPGRFVHGKELFWLAGMLFLLILCLAVYLFRNRGDLTRQVRSLQMGKPILLLVICILAYGIILIISRTFFDERIPTDERLLSPILVMGLLLLVWFLGKLWSQKIWLGYIIVVAMSLVLITTNLTRSVQMVRSYHEIGRGYASARDHVSETYAYLRNRPEIPVYSNAFAGIYFWTGRVTYTLPLPSEIPAMKANMHQTGAYLVIFDSIPVELYGTTIEQLSQGLVEQIRLSEATIYRSP